MSIKNLEYELKNYKDEPIVAQWQDYYDFKCRSCGEKFADEFASDEDVALCKWCNGEEE